MWIADIAFGAILGTILGACCVDYYMAKPYRKLLAEAQSELVSVKKELTLCEAEISHLQAKRDSRGRFTK